MVASSTEAVTGEEGETRTTSASAGQEETLTEALPGLREKIEGEILFCNADNINTDGPYSDVSGRCFD